MTTLEVVLAFILGVRTMIFVSCIAVAILYWPIFIVALGDIFNPKLSKERDRLTAQLRLLGTPEDATRRLTAAALVAGMALFVSMFILSGAEALIRGWGLGATSITNSVTVRVIFHIGILTALSLKLFPITQSRFGRYGYLAWCSLMALGVVSLTVIQLV